MLHHHFIKGSRLEIILLDYTLPTIPAPFRSNLITIDKKTTAVISIDLQEI